MPMQSRTHTPDFTQNNGNVRSDDIAIIGLSGRFSGARNVQQYWDNLVQEVSSLQEAPAERTELTKLTPAQRAHIRYGGFLPGADQFDPLFFHISPKEAEHMDPRQRLFLEESWKAIEDAGYSLQDMSGSKCGIFVGLQQGEYLERFLGETNEHVPTGNSLSVIPARISYLLNLKGPSIALDTACSSSLVALSLACDSLHNGSSEMAIAGGVQLMLTPWIYMSLGKLGMLNTDGICKPFAEEADGIGLGEGVGAVLLKKYAAAKPDGTISTESSQASGSIRTVKPMALPPQMVSHRQRWNVKSMRNPGLTLSTSAMWRHMARAPGWGIRSRSLPSRRPSAHSRTRSNIAISAQSKAT